MPTEPTWTTAARHRLLALHQRGAGWSYRPGNPAVVEASALAALALLADGSAAAPTAAPVEAAHWIADRCRRLDGSTGVAAGVEATTPGWSTPFAMLLWNAVGGFEAERRAARAWLLEQKGKGYQPRPHNPMGHDVTLIGWPWVADTHSWVEPTATALLALAPSVPRDQSRLREGVRLLIDRAIATGGWNLGNPIVFGQTLRPLPGPTGLALLALARVGRDLAPPAVIERAVAYLQGVVAATAAPTSLGWAVLGLRAWMPGAASAAAPRLEVAADRIMDRNPGPVELAMLLLASGERSLPILQIKPPLDREATQ